MASENPRNPFINLGVGHIICGVVTLAAQAAIIALSERGDGIHIGIGIWVGITFIITGGLTISQSNVTFRKVMLIMSVIFAIFLSFWAFIAAIVHLGIDAFGNRGGYSHERWLRVTQGFCGLFEIALSIVTLCQRTQDQQGRVIAVPQAQTLITVQPGVPAGYPMTGGQVITYQQPPPQVMAYPQAYPQAVVGAPPPYPGQVYHQQK